MSTTTASVGTSTEFLEKTTANPNNATTFNTKGEDVPNGYRLDEIDSYEDWYKRLWDHNEGEKNGNWRNQKIVARKVKRDVAENIANQIDLHKSRKNRVINLMNRIDGRKYNSLGSLEMVAFCLCQIVCKSDSICERYYWPTAKPEKNDPLFQKMHDDLGFDPQMTQRVIQKLRYDKDLNL